MITYPNDDRVICETCGQTAFQREGDVRHGTVTRRIVYQTHHQGLETQDHHDVFGRINAFQEQVHKLEAEMNALPEHMKELSSGRIIQFEITSVTPTACEVRTQIVPYVTVRAYGQTEEVKLEPVEIGGSILNELKAAAEIAVTKLRLQHERGNF